MFKMKYGYRLELQTSETIKLFSSTKILKDKAEVVEVVLVKCNLLDNQYQKKSEVLYTFTPNKSCAYFLNVEPSNLVFLITCNN